RLRINSRAFSSLMENARELMRSLERREFGDAVQIINELNKVRDRVLYQAVGRLTRKPHTAIVNFHIDPNCTESRDMSELADATERLNYVVSMTERAANRTMDLVEATAPVISRLNEDARELRADWQRFQRREMDAEEFRQLVKRIDQFFERGERDSGKINSQL